MKMGKVPPEFGEEQYKDPKKIRRSCRKDMFKQILSLASCCLCNLCTFVMFKAESSRHCQVVSKKQCISTFI